MLRIIRQRRGLCARIVRYGLRCFGVCLCVVGSSAWSAAPTSYPSRPVRFIVAQSAGGNADFIARLIGVELTRRLGQQFVVDNRGGGGGLIAAEMVVQAPPDGYTLLLVGSSFGVNPSLYKKLPYDPLRDLATVTLASTAAQILVVNPALPVHTVQDLIRLAQAKPGQLNYGSSGNGGGPHLAGALFDLMAKTQMTHIPYKGASASIVDLLSGRIQLVFATMPSVMNHVRSTKLRGIAVTSTQRSPLVPQLPTVAEAGLPGFQSGTWQGILVPRFTPPAVISTLHREIANSMQTAEIKQKVESEGGMVVANTPQVFALWLRDEVAKWAKVVKAAHIVLE